MQHSDHRGLKVEGQAALQDWHPRAVRNYLEEEVQHFGHRGLHVGLQAALQDWHPRAVGHYLEEELSLIHI